MAKKGLSEGMCKLLRDGLNGPISPWHYSSTNVGRAKKEQWIQGNGENPVKYTTTEKGKLALQEDEANR